MKIVDATPNDSKAISEVMKAVWRDSYVNEALGITIEEIEKKLVTDDPEKRAQKIKENPAIHYIVAKENEKVVGYCVVKKGKESNTLVALNILPVYQGQKIGTKLMEQALAWLGDELPITLRVIEYNPRAIHFYKKFGFKPSGKKIVIPNELSNGKSIPRRELIRQ